ncbi:hypothetical protein D3C77_528550 [compost metagenome]
MKFFIQNSEQTNRLRFVAGLFLDFLHRHFGRRQPDISPASRQCPITVKLLLYEQYFVILKHNAANIHLRRCIPALIGE